MNDNANTSIVIQFDQYTEFLVKGNLEYWNEIPFDFKPVEVLARSIGAAEWEYVNPCALRGTVLKLAYKKLVELPLMPGLVK